MSRYLSRLNEWTAGILPLIALLILALPSAGQPSLTLEDAIQQGLMNNFQVRIAKNKAEIARQDVTYGNAGFLPSLNAYATYDKASLDSKVKVASGGELDQSPAVSDLTTAGLKAQWVLFDGAGMFTGYDKLKSLWKLSDLEMKITMEEVLSDIILAYCDIIRQAQLLDACRQQLELSDYRYFLAKERYDSGLGSEQEWLQAGVIRQADTTAWTRQMTALQKSKITLNQLLAADIQRDFITEDTIPLEKLPELETVLKSGLMLNNYFKLASEALNLSNLDIRSLKAGQYPRLVLTGAYSYYENETEASFIKYNRNFGPQIGLKADVSIFDGMKLRQKIKNARLNSENEELHLREMEQSVTAAILDSYLDYQSQLQLIALGKEGLKLARKNLGIAKEAFLSGTISALQLREAQDDLFKASASLVNAVFEVKVKETDLLRQSGLLIK